MEKIAVDLGNVQKTLFLPLWGRALETKKEKPLLVDETAVEIMGKVDYDFSVIAKNINGISQVAWIIRSITIDKIIKEFLVQHPQATIINIGCGLDTTFERVDNGTLLWYDLDLPDVIDLRRKFISETERRKFICSSFLESGWLKEIRVTDKVLFIAAGVFYYFDEQEIKDFLLRLADSFPGSQVFFDACSPRGIWAANEMVIRNTGLDEKSFLKWGLKNPGKIATWDSRLRIKATYLFFKSRNNRMALGTRIVGYVSDLLMMQYMVHLEIVE
jgi:O-methyltransferase involved in polyketide biosynthesis